MNEKCVVGLCFFLEVDDCALDLSIQVVQFFITD